MEVSNTSMGRATLDALQKICELGPDLNDDQRAVREPAVRRLYQIVGGLEVLAERRVERSYYEQYRRALEACHITLPKQVAGE